MNDPVKLAKELIDEFMGFTNKPDIKPDIEIPENPSPAVIQAMLNLKEAVDALEPHYVYFLSQYLPNDHLPQWLDIMGCEHGWYKYRVNASSPYIQGILLNIDTSWRRAIADIMYAQFNVPDVSWVLENQCK